MRTGVSTYQQNSRIDSRNMSREDREALILEYSPLVRQVVERMAIRLPPNISKEELLSAGILGLFDALEKYDSDKGAAFRTYAHMRIKGAILDELRKMDWVSRSVRRDIHKIEDARRSLEIKLGRDANDFEVAEELEVDLETYYRMTVRANGAGLFSLDGVVPDCFGGDFVGFSPEGASPWDEVRKKELKKTIAEALEKLPEKEQLIMSLYYYEDLTLKEIAEVMNLTESRICQIHSKVVIKLRTKLKTYYED